MIKSDIPRVGDILYRAYNNVAYKHGFPQKIRNPEIGKVWAWNIMRYGPSVRLVAEVDGQVAGITCLNPRGTLGGIGQLRLIRISSKDFVASLSAKRW